MEKQKAQIWKSFTKFKAKGKRLKANGPELKIVHKSKAIAHQLQIVYEFHKKLRAKGKKPMALNLISFTKSKPWPIAIAIVQQFKSFKMSAKGQLLMAKGPELQILCEIPNRLRLFWISSRGFERTLHAYLLGPEDLSTRSCTWLVRHWYNRAIQNIRH